MSAVHKTQEQIRAEILTLESAMRELPKLEIRTEHYYADGLVAREAYLPEDCYVTGHIHLHSHIVVIPYGEVDVISEHGSRRYVGPCTFVGQPGSKRAVHAIKDTLWIAINASTAKTPEEAEAQNVAKTHEQYLIAQEGKKCLT